MPRGLTTLGGLALLLAAAPAGAQQPVSNGTYPPGTAFHAVASGVAKVVTDAGALRMAVQPYSGSSTFLPLLDSASSSSASTRGC